jgi:hypothetical protein
VTLETLETTSKEIVLQVYLTVKRWSNGGYLPWCQVCSWLRHLTPYPKRGQGRRLSTGKWCNRSNCHKRVPTLWSTICLQSSLNMDQELITISTTSG